MKKLLLTLTAVGGLLLNTQAQKAYFKFGAGYGAPQAGQSRGVDGFPLNGHATYSGSSGFTAMDLKKASFAAGYNINIAFGCMINDNFGIELGSLIGVAPAQFKSDYTFSNTTSSGKGTSTQLATTPVLLLPSLIVQAGKKAKLYLKAGPVIPLRTKIENRISQTVYEQGKQYDIFGTSVLSNHLKLGLAAAVGVRFAIVKNVHVSVESNLLSMSLYAKETNITSYRINGEDVLRYIQPTTYYKSKFSGDGEGSYSNPFSSIGGSIGIILVL